MGNNEVSIYQSVGARIREERNRKGWSQSKLSEISSISLPHISDIELGKKRMKLETFLKIAEALQVSTDTLLRLDIPEVKEQYDSELSGILSDCTSKEIESIFRIIKEFKSSMHSKSSSEFE